LYNLGVFSRHHLTCRRCGGPFSAVRIDAAFCSRRCRRSTSTPVPAAVEAVTAAVVTGEEAAPAPVGSAVLTEDDIDAGWRQMGGFLVPPRDPRLCATVYPE
jgi:hypothetical protein